MTQQAKEAAVYRFIDALSEYYGTDIRPELRRYLFTNQFDYTAPTYQHNVGLVCVKRNQSVKNYRFLFATKELVEEKTVPGGNFEECYLFPLFTFDTSVPPPRIVVTENLSTEFQYTIQAAYPGYRRLTVKELAGYFYAVGYHTPYTTHYLDSIKQMQFLSFPVPKDPQLLLQLSDLGCMLMEFHLFNDTILHTHRLFYYKGYPEPKEWGQPILLLQTHYDADRQRVLLTKDYSLLGIRPQVYDYQLATVRPLHRYLRQRAGSPLTPEVFYHILDILIVINNALHFESLINSINILGAPHYHPNHAALRRRARAHDTKNPTTGLFAF